MENELYFLFAFVGVVLILGAVALILWSRRGKKSIQTKFIGLRSSTMQAREREGIARRGRYIWKEPGGLEADVILDGGMVYDTPNGKLVLVDLDTFQPIRLSQMTPQEQALFEDQTRTMTDDQKATFVPDKNPVDPEARRLAVIQAVGYRGSCANDADLVKAYQKDGSFKLIPPVWRRLSGEILNKIRKDTRWSQLNDIGGALWMFLQRATPWIAIATLVTLLIFGGIMVKAV